MEFIFIWSPICLVWLMIPMRGVTDRQEMERWKKWKRERGQKSYQVCLVLGRETEREGRVPAPGLGGKGGDSCVLCSGPRCWLKDPDLRSAGTAWLYHLEHRGLMCRSRAQQGPKGGAKRGGGPAWARRQTKPTSSPPSYTPGLLSLCSLCLTSCFRDHRGGAPSSGREVIEPISVTVISAFYSSLLFCCVTCPPPVYRSVQAVRTHKNPSGLLRYVSGRIPV